MVGAPFRWYWPPSSRLLPDNLSKSLRQPARSLRFHYTTGPRPAESHGGLKRCEMEYRDALPPLPRSPRVLAVGVDAGEPIWLERWMEEGALPTLSRIIKRGTYGRLRSVGERFYDAV